ncbi:MAG: helix-turn-helix domain-containing protein, partial [Eisenbergiella sp.]
RGGVYELIRSGQLRSFRCGHQYRITPQALDEFMGRAG